jgi:DNA sulfur modification protein DndD
VKLLQNRKQRQELTVRLKELDGQERSIQDDKNEIDEARQAAEAELGEVKGQLKGLEGLQADMRELETLEASLADGRNAEAELARDLRALLGRGWRSLAVTPLSRVLFEIRARNSAITGHNRTIEQARTQVTLLQNQLAGGECPTCHQLLPSPGPIVEEQLHVSEKQLAQLLEETGGGVLDLELERRVSSLIDETTIPAYIKTQRDLAQLRFLQYERTRRHGEIRDRMQGHSAATVRVLADRAQALEDAIEELTEGEKRNARRAESLAKEKAKLNRELQRLPGSATSAVGFEAAFYHYFNDLLIQCIEEFRSDVRMRVEDDAQRLFLHLIRDPEGYGGLRISEDYQIELLDPRGAPQATSQGGKQLLALSLIGALKRAAVRGGPVVLDSPLGRLDLKHRANVLREWIPALGGQTVLLVQSGELTLDEAKKNLGDLVGRMYQIVRPTNSPEIAEIEEVV